MDDPRLATMSPDELKRAMLTRLAQQERALIALRAMRCKRMLSFLFSLINFRSCLNVNCPLRITLTSYS